MSRERDSVRAGEIVYKPRGYIELNNKSPISDQIILLRWDYDTNKSRKNFLFRIAPNSQAILGLLIEKQDGWYIQADLTKTEIKLEHGHQLSRIVDSWD